MSALNRPPTNAKVSTWGDDASQGDNDRKIPPLSLVDIDDWDFRQKPMHRRSNSDHRPETQSYLRNTFLYGDNFKNNLEQFLPQSVLQEITQPDNTPPSLSHFEYMLNEDNVDDARIYFNELLAQEKDPKEKGKLLRAAAEIAKRLSDPNLAFELLELGTAIDPETAASWIDRAKILDEQGDYVEAENILQQGCKAVKHCEQIVRKLLKSYERTNNPYAARHFMGKALNDESFDRDFIFTEGAIFELHQGNQAAAMEILNKLRETSGWKPNVFIELILFFEKSGITSKTFSIIEEGSRLSPRNAIVCQALLRHQPTIADAIKIIRDSSPKWTLEFTDKMTGTVCEMLAWKNRIPEMRILVSESVAYCASKQRYKQLVFAAVMELTHGDQAMAPLLLNLALDVAPYKARPLVSLLIAKNFELNGDYDNAERVFSDCVAEYSPEWRVFLEYAQFYVHRNMIPKAIEVLNRALEEHVGSGRLWAFRVQLEAYNGIKSQLVMLTTAINRVPKSGEVWCEAARIAMNPLCEYFSVDSAKQFLEFAYRFTPQHGDTLVEMIRAEMLEKGLYADLSNIRQKFVTSEGNYGQLFLFIRGIEERPMGEIFELAVREVRQDLNEHRRLYQRAITRTSFISASVIGEEKKLKADISKQSLSTFAFGLAKLSRLMTDPKKCETNQQVLSIVIGTSACIQ